MTTSLPAVGREPATDTPLFVHEFLKSVSPRDIVLDLGSGTGSFDYTLYPCRFAACDNHPDVGRHRLPPNVGFVLGSADKLPFPSGLFHSVVCNWIFEHLHDPAAALTEIERVLKPRGYLYISIPNGTSFEDRLYRLLYEDRGGHEQQFNLESFLRVVYAHSSFKLVSFADWGAGFVYLQHVRAGAYLRQALFSFFRLVKTLTGRRLTERSNYILLFQQLEGWGHRQMTDVCTFCGSGHQVATPHTEKTWVCPSCGKENPYV